MIAVDFHLKDKRDSTQACNERCEIISAYLAGEVHLDQKQLRDLIKQLGDYVDFVA